MYEGRKEIFPMNWEQAVQWLRKQPGCEKLVRDCYFDDPLFDAAKRYYDGEEWKSVSALLPSLPGLALDIGAGRGIASYSLAKDGWKVIALEPDTSNLVGAGAIRALAEEAGVDIEVVEEWGERLPFADAAFDCVHARQVLHHAKNIEAFCREVARVLKPGGVFIATREHIIDLPEELPVFLASHPLHSLYGGENAFNLETYLDAILQAGLLLTQVISPIESPINYFPTVEEVVNNQALSLWPWNTRLGNTVMKKDAARRLIAPGRLYSFVARLPRYDDSAASDLVATIAEQGSRLVALEARLDAREIQLAKRLNGNVIGKRKSLRKIFAKIKKLFGL